ncbi:MAG TPA: hypothetical protein VEB18_00325 [Candidatus Paceibacterota bacterium]|nr:hypothetical protein [Candidatus Paceibacterota bacterium]
MDPLLDKKYISSKEASELSGYHSDYLARLCRTGAINGTRVGRTWLINRASLLRFVANQDLQKKKNAQELSRLREKEYRAAQVVSKPTVSAKKSRSVPSPYFAPSQATAALSAILIVTGGLLIGQTKVIESSSNFIVANIREIGADQSALALNSGRVLASSLDTTYRLIGEEYLHVLDAGLQEYLEQVYTTGDAVLVVGVATRDLANSTPAGNLFAVWSSFTNEVMGYSLAALYGLGDGAMQITNSAPTQIAYSYNKGVEAWVNRTSSLVEAESERQIALGVLIGDVVEDKALALVGNAALTYETTRTRFADAFSARLAIGNENLASVATLLAAPEEVVVVEALDKPPVSNSSYSIASGTGAKVMEQELTFSGILPPNLVASVIASGSKVQGASTSENQSTTTNRDVPESLTILESEIAEDSPNLEVALAAANSSGFAGSLQQMGEQLALNTYLYINGLFEGAGTAIASLFTPTQITVLPPSTPPSVLPAPNNSTTVSSPAPVAVTSSAPAITNVNNYLTFTGVSFDYLELRLAQLRRQVSNDIYDSIDESNDSSGGGGSGSVTSVDISGGTTGFTFTGGPVTSTGTFTLGGTLGIANGGTGVTTAPAYGELLVGDGLGGYTLLATSSLGIGAGSGSPGGANTQVQFNNGGLFAGDSGFTYDATNDRLTVTNASTTNFSSSYASSTSGFFGNLSVGTFTGILKAASGVVSTAVAGTDYENVLSFTYPLIRSSNTISLAFGTTTANTWGAHNIFSSLFATNASTTNATTTALGINSETFTDLTGAGLQNSGGILTLNATGDWTGTLDGQEGSYYLARANHTGTQLASTISDFNSAVGSYISGSSTIPHIGGTAYGNILSWTGSTWESRATSTLGVALSDTSGTLGVGQGGTGLTSYTQGDILYADAGGNLAKLGIGSAGQVLKVSGGLPAWGSDLTSGGGGGAGAWATTSDSLAIYPTDTTNVVIVGNSATTTSNSILEVFGRSYFSNVVGIGTTSPGALLSVAGNAIINGLTTVYGGINAPIYTATSTTATSTLPNLSLSRLSIGGDFITDFVGTGLALSGSTLTTTLGTTIDLASEVSGVLSVSNGGTGWGSIQSGTLLYGNGTGALATTTAGTAGNILALLNGVPTWTASSTFLLESEADSESELEALLADVTNVFTNNDGTLADDDLTNNSLEDLSDVATMTKNFGDLLYWNGSAWTDIATSSLGIVTSAITAIGPAGQTADGPTVTFATSTGSFNGLTTGLTITGSGDTLTFAPSLSGTLDNAGLTNSTISYGGVTLSLGGSDATPAFNLADATGLPISTGVSGLGTGVAAFLETPSSANLASAVTDETGTGSLVFSAGPTFTGTVNATNLTVSSNLTGGDIRANQDIFTSGAGDDLWLGNTTQGSANIQLYASGLGYFSGNVGIGTTSPYAPLSVVGQAVAEYFTATSMAATSTLPNASIMNFSIGDDYFTDLVGTGLALSGSTLTTTLGIAVDLASEVTGILPVGNGGTGWAAVQSGALLYGNGSSALATTSAGTAGNILALLNGVPTWTASSTFLLEAETDTESELEALLTDVTNVFTNNDGALADDDLTNNSIEDLSDVAAMTENYGDLLYWNGSAWADIATSSLGLLTNAVTAIGPTGQTADGPTVTFATSTGSFNGLTTAITIAGSGDTLTFTPSLSGTLTVAGGGTGAASFTDNRILTGNGTSALSAEANLTFDGSLLTVTGNASTTQLTTTESTYLATTGGNVGIGTTTPSTKLDVNGYVMIEGQNRLVFEQYTSTTNHGPWIAYSSSNDSLDIVSGFNPNTNGLGNGGGIRFGIASGATWAARMVLDPNGYLGIGTTTPGSLLSLNGIANFTTATTTFYSTGGINLAAGCFAIGGTCVGGGSGSGTVGSGTTGQFPYYAANGTTLTATSSLFMATSGNIGIGTTTPEAKVQITDGSLEIANSLGGDFGIILADILGARADTDYWLGLVTENDGDDDDLFQIGDGTTIGSNPFLTINTSGSVGIGTTSPATLLSVGGSGYLTGGLGVGMLNTTTGTIQASSDIYASGTYYYGDAKTVIQYDDSWLRLNPTGAFTSGIYTGGGIVRMDGTLQIGASGATLSVASGGDLTLGAGIQLDFADEVADKIYLFSNSYGVGIESGSLTNWSGGQYRWRIGGTSASGGTEYMSLTNVGLGLSTSTPSRKLSLTDAVSTAQVAIAYDGTRYTQFLTDTNGDFNLDPSGNDVILGNENLWVCSGGCSGTPAGVGNIIADTAIGVGTSTPWAGLSVASGSAIVAAENTLATSTSMTIDWRNGNQQLVRLGTSATTISFSGYIQGQKLVLTVCNPGATAGAISWSTQILWPGGTAPTQTTTANKCDIWSFVATQATSTLKIFGAQTANF